MIIRTYENEFINTDCFRSFKVNCMSKKSWSPQEDYCLTLELEDYDGRNTKTMELFQDDEFPGELHDVLKNLVIDKIAEANILKLGYLDIYAEIERFFKNNSMNELEIKVEIGGNEYPCSWGFTHSDELRFIPRGGFGEEETKSILKSANKILNAHLLFPTPLDCVLNRYEEEDNVTLFINGIPRYKRDYKKLSELYKTVHYVTEEDEEEFEETDIDRIKEYLREHRIENYTLFVVNEEGKEKVIGVFFDWYRH